MNGEDITTKKEFKRNQKIGRVYQNPAMGTCPTMTILENMSLADNKGKFFGLSSGINKARKEYYREILSQLGLGLENKMDVKVGSLSGGQRQRVWIALALAQQTDILLLDEPTTYLDIAYQVEILDLLMELNKKRGTTILMVLHDINLSARYADHIFAMSKGKLIAQGAPSKVISRELMKEIYGLDCQIIEDPVSGTPLIVPEGRYHKEAQNEKSFCA